VKLNDDIQLVTKLIMRGGIAPLLKHHHGMVTRHRDNFTYTFSVIIT